METILEMPDGKQVTLDHEGELTEDAIKKVAEQLGYDVPMSKTDILRNVLGEGTRVAGAITGAIKGSKYGPGGAVLGGIGGAALAEVPASMLNTRNVSTGEHISNIALAGLQPEAKAASLLGRVGRGMVQGGSIGGAYDISRNLIDTQQLPSLQEFGTNVGVGALVGGTLEGAIGPRLSAGPVSKTPITDALGQRKATSLEQANAEANAIITGGQPSAEASAQVTPTGTPVEGGGMQVVNKDLAHNGEPIRASVDDEAAMDAAAAAQAKASSTEAEIKKAADAFEVPKMGLEKPETIASAAVKFSDGEIKTGPNHASIVDSIPEGDLRGSDDGFVTSTGRYVDRTEGMKIAKASGQVDKLTTRAGLATEILNAKTLPPEAVFTKQTIKTKEMPEGKSFTQIDIPNPDPKGRPLFSGSLSDALNEGYKFNLPSKIPEGKTTFAELTAAREAELAAKAPKAVVEPIKAPVATKTPKVAEVPAKAKGQPIKGIPKVISDIPPTTPEGALVHLGEEPEMRTRNLAKRVIESEIVPQETREALKADPSILYERHRHADYMNKAESATDSELKQMIAEATNHDEGILYRRELSNRLIRDKKYTEAAGVFADQAQMLTPHGQALASARMIRTSIGDLAEVEQTVAKAGRNLTKEQKERVLDLSSKEIAAQKAKNIAERRAREFPSKENYDAFRKAEGEHGDAKKIFEDYSATVAPRDFADMLVKIVQGNLLTPLSIIANPFGNLIWSPVKKTSMAISSVMDALMTTGIKAVGKALGRDTSQVKRSIMASNPLPGMMELAAMADGTKVAAKEMLTGPSKESYIKMEVQRGFQPLRSLMDSFTGENLARDEAGKVKAWDRTKAFIEGTIGVPPETMFRLLSFGDKPFRRAETVRAFLEQARLKGIKDEDLEHFMTFPDAKTKDIVDKATRNAIFADENAGITTLNRFLDSDLAKLLRVDKIPLLKGAMKVFGRLTVPFRQFPLNYALTALNFAAPHLAVAKASYYAWKSASILGSKGMTAKAIASSSLEFRRKFLINMGEAAMGVMMYSAAEILWHKGLISESPAKTSAERSDQAEAMGASKLNTSGIDRYLKGGDPSYKRGDTLVDWTRMGIPAVIFHVYTQQASKERDTAGKIGLPNPVTSIYDHPFQKAVSAVPGMGSFVFDQSFLAGTSSLMEAIKDPDPDSPAFKNWMNNMWKAVTSIAVPNTVDAVARANMPYVPELRGNTEAETLGNIWEHKTLQLPADERGVVLKRNTWGRPIPRTPEGANPYVYGLIDVTRAGQLAGDAHDDALRALYKQTNRDSIWPDPVGRSIDFQGDSKELDPEDVEKLQETIGGLRRERMEQFVDSHVWERLTPTEKVDGLEKIYQGANEDGRKKFMTSSGIYQKYFSNDPDQKTTSRSTESLIGEEYKKKHRP